VSSSCLTIDACVLIMCAFTKKKINEKKRCSKSFLGYPSLWLLASPFLMVNILVYYFFCVPSFSRFHFHHLLYPRKISIIFYFLLTSFWFLWVPSLAYPQLVWELGLRSFYAFAAGAVVVCCIPDFKVHVSMFCMRVFFYMCTFLS
jgi:hypothetical protein